MSQIFRAKNKYAKKSLAERIKNLNSVSKTHVQQDSSDSKGTLPMTDENMCTPPTSTFALTDSSNILTDEEKSWQHGRRIVEIHHMAKQMTCTDCGCRLALQNIVHEVRYGLGSVFMVECDCGIVNEVIPLPLYRELFPNLISHKQEFLVSEILHEQYVAHNAEEDVKTLQRLITNTNPTDNVLVRHSTTVSSMIEMYKFENESDANFETLATLVDQKVITRAIGVKIAKSGLQLKHLKTAYDRNSLDKVMLENVNGKPRVTSTKRIIMALNDFFQKKISIATTAVAN